MKVKKIITIIFTVIFLIVPMHVHATHDQFLRIHVETKILSKNTPQANYQFKIESVSENAPMPENDIVSLDKLTGDVYFTKPEYIAPGDYEYVIYQLPVNDKKWVIDDKKHNITVRVINGDQNNQFMTLVLENDKKISQITFNNIYGGNPQTGQLNWPIPILYGTGALLILIGLILTIRQKNEE